MHAVFGDNVCTSPQTDRPNHASTLLLSFLQDALLAVLPPNQQCQLKVQTSSCRLVDKYFLWLLSYKRNQLTYSLPNNSNLALKGVNLHGISNFSKNLFRLGIFTMILEISEIGEWRH